MKPRELQTVLAIIAVAALFSTVATQIYVLVEPTRSALWLLILFFAVGLGVAWIAMRANARHAQAATAGEHPAEPAPQARARVSSTPPDSTGTPLKPAP